MAVSKIFGVNSSETVETIRRNFVLQNIEDI